MPIGSATFPSARRCFLFGRGQVSAILIAATVWTIEPTMFVLTIAIAKAISPPPSLCMSTTATPQRMLRSVMTIMGTRLSTRSWNSSPSAPMPPNGIAMIRIAPAISMSSVWLRSSRTRKAEIITGPSSSRRIRIAAPIHSFSASGFFAASLSATSSMPKFMK